jgi:Domain of unknown function (DUF4186)
VSATSLTFHVFTFHESVFALPFLLRCAILIGVRLTNGPEAVAPLRPGSFFRPGAGPRACNVVRDLDELFAALERSSFRRGFHLRDKELGYLRKHGLRKILRHAAELIAQRLAPARLVNDGRQTPTGNHPVFVAQHATGTCCRGCLEKWHGIQQGEALSEDQQAYVVRVIERWLRGEQSAHGEQGQEDPRLFGD